MKDQEYSYLKEKIFKLTDLDIDSYKSQQMRRRLEGYVARSTASNVISYCRMLEQDKDMRRKLMDFLAINVSEFFRDVPQFQYLKAVILPELLRHGHRLNIWSAACSCGQEPYSIAIILEDICLSSDQYRILATDIDESAMEQAIKGGPYSSADVRNVEKRALQQYFIKTEEGYWITDRIKRRVNFKRNNLLRDQFERGFDLIVCRNVIIYFSEDVRDNLYQKFYQSMKVGGSLFIGGSEVILRPVDLGFSILSPSFYRKLPVNAQATLPSRV